MALQCFRLQLFWLDFTPVITYFDFLSEISFVCKNENKVGALATAVLETSRFAQFSFPHLHISTLPYFYSPLFLFLSSLILFLHSLISTLPYVFLFLLSLISISALSYFYFYSPLFLFLLFLISSFNFRSHFFRFPLFNQLSFRFFPFPTPLPLFFSILKQMDNTCNFLYFFSWFPNGLLTKTNCFYTYHSSQ